MRRYVTILILPIPAQIERVTSPTISTSPRYQHTSLVKSGPKRVDGKTFHLRFIPKILGFGVSLDKPGHVYPYGIRVREEESKLLVRG